MYLAKRPAAIPAKRVASGWRHERPKIWTSVRPENGTTARTVAAAESSR
jgi:hypothetical protein